MPRVCWLLAETSVGYRLVCCASQRSAELEVAPDAAPEERAAAVHRRLEESGYRGEPVVLALSSMNCLARNIPLVGRSMARNRQAMAYGLEEFLPLAAEDAVCDFITFDGEALGVAVEASALRSFLAVLEKGGVPIISVTPRAILALQQQMETEPWRGRRVLLWQDEGHVELFELLDGRPSLWQCLPASPPAVARELSVRRFNGHGQESIAYATWNLSPELVNAATVDEGRSVEALDYCMANVARATNASPDSYAPSLSCRGISCAPINKPLSLEAATIEGASKVAAGLYEPWIELRRDALGSYDRFRSLRGRVRLFAAAVTCFLLAAVTAFWIRAAKYDQLAESLQREQERVYQESFPGKAAPVGIRSRLESEYRKLAGVTGHAAGMPQLNSAVQSLADALRPLPEELRFRLLEVRLDESGVHIQAEVRQHGDADLLAGALRTAGLAVNQPRTETLANKGVAVTIHAGRAETP